MSAKSTSRRVRIGLEGDLLPLAALRTQGVVAFAATLVLAALTGLSLGSAANLMPRADDPSGPFLGI